MAKRKAKKAKRPSVAREYGITKKSYDKLRREGENTRRRIKNILDKASPDSGFLPNAEDYTLKNLLLRVQNGEKVRDIVKDMSRINYQAFQSEERPLYRTKYGFYVDAKDQARLEKAVNTANRNIQKARQKFSDVEDLMPAEFDANKILNEISSEQALKNRLQGLKEFTQKKLTPDMIEGVFTTQAEYNYLKAIIDRENERREERKKVNPQEVGYLKSQQSYDSEPIDINKLQDLESLRRKADQWDDPAIVDRANRYIDNYLQALENQEAALADSIGTSKSMRDKFDDIRGILNRLRNNVDLTTMASSQLPYIDIAIVSGATLGDVAFNEFYEAWMEFGETF